MQCTVADVSCGLAIASSGGISPTACAVVGLSEGACCTMWRCCCVPCGHTAATVLVMLVLVMLVLVMLVLVMLVLVMLAAQR